MIPGYTFNPIELFFEYGRKLTLVQRTNDWTNWTNRTNEWTERTVKIICDVPLSLWPIFVHFSIFRQRLLCAHIRTLTFTTQYTEYTCLTIFVCTLWCTLLAKEWRGRRRVDAQSNYRKWTCRRANEDIHKCNYIRISRVSFLPWWVTSSTMKWTRGDVARQPSSNITQNSQMELRNKKKPVYVLPAIRLFHDRRKKHNSGMNKWKWRKKMNVRVYSIRLLNVSSVSFSQMSSFEWIREWTHKFIQSSQLLKWS